MNEELKKSVNLALGKIKQGDQKGLQDLYDQMGRLMLYVANNVLNNKESSEDVVQETLITIVKNIDKFNAFTNGYAWVLTLTRNNAINLFNKENRADKVDPNENEYLFTDEEEDGQSLFNELVSSFSPEDQKIIYYSFVMEYSVRDIAQEINKSKSYVAKRLNDLIKIMQEKVK